MKRQYVPELEHPCVWVLPGQLLKAVSFFEAMGWELINDRNPKWDTGQARFMANPGGGPIIQLTDETGQTPGEPGYAFHLAFSHPDIPELVSWWAGWCMDREIAFGTEGGGGSKVLFLIPSVFYGGFEACLPEIRQSNAMGHNPPNTYL